MVCCHCGRVIFSFPQTHFSAIRLRIGKIIRQSSASGSLDFFTLLMYITHGEFHEEGAIPYRLTGQSSTALEQTRRVKRTVSTVPWSLVRNIP